MFQIFYKPWLVCNFVILHSTFSFFLGCVISPWPIITWQIATVSTIWRNLWLQFKSKFKGYCGDWHDFTCRWWKIHFLTVANLICSYVWRPKRIVFSYTAGMKGGSMVYFVLYQLFGFTCALAEEFRAVKKWIVMGYEGKREKGDGNERWWVESCPIPWLDIFRLLDVFVIKCPGFII